MSCDFEHLRKKLREWDLVKFKRRKELNDGTRKIQEVEKIVEAKNKTGDQLREIKSSNLEKLLSEKDRKGQWRGEREKCEIQLWHLKK